MEKEAKKMLDHDMFWLEKEAAYVKAVAEAHPDLPHWVCSQLKSRVKCMRELLNEMEEVFDEGLK